jgi:hypothetical protein
MKIETMDEFLARGGKIDRRSPAPEKFDHGAIYRKDKQLNALRQLKKQVSDPVTAQKIDSAIFVRLEILKVIF